MMTHRPEYNFYLFFEKKQLIAPQLLCVCIVGKSLEVTATSDLSGAVGWCCSFGVVVLSYFAVVVRDIFCDMTPPIRCSRRSRRRWGVWVTSRLFD